MLTAVVMRSLFSGGFVLQVDSVFGPRPGPLEWSFGTPIVLLIHAGVRLLGGQTTGKLCMALSLYLCGFGAMLVVRRLPWWAQCAAGLLAVLNPWVFDRLAEGQWGIVGAAGSLFLWVAAWEWLQRQPGGAPAIALGLATVLTAAFSPNFVGILAVLALLAVLGTRVWRDRRRLRWSGAAVGLSALLLLYGALPFFLHHGGGTYAAVQQFGRADFTAFRATPDGRYGVLPALAGLYGDWAERTGRIPVATAGNPWWPIAAAVLIGLAVVGAWRRRGRAWLLAAGAIGLGLSAITATTWGLDAAVSLSRHVPLVAAYRDTQKWDALWLVALVVLGAEGVAALGAGRRRGRAVPWLGPAAALLMALATLLPAGLHEIQDLPRLTQPVAYPADWYAAAAYVDASVPPAAPIAVLPWHLYEPLPFAGRVVANPATYFFPGTLITPSDPELPGQVAPAPSPGDVGALSLRPEPKPCALADALRSIGARWVLLEQTVGSMDVLDRLRPCGFRVAEGAPGTTAVLAG